jgi:DNA primase
VQLALDADSAGQEAMVRAARLAAGRKLELRVVPLPAGSDPADLLARQGQGPIRELVEASVPFVRFRVERELAEGDLASAEGKDRVIDALRPVFAVLAPSAMREELIKLVAERTDLAPSLVSGWLAEASGRSAEPGPGGVPGARPGSARARRPGAAGPPMAPALDPAARSERDFLVQCLALPTAGRDALAAIDVETAFTWSLARRAALHLREHLDAPGERLAEDDGELAALIAELAVRAAEQTASRAALEAETLKLELGHVERQIAAARTSRSGDVATLAARRTELKDAVDEAIDRVMGEADPVRHTN